MRVESVSTALVDFTKPSARSRGLLGPGGNFAAFNIISNTYVLEVGGRGKHSPLKIDSRAITCKHATQPQRLCVRSVATESKFWNPNAERRGPDLINIYLFPYYLPEQLLHNCVMHWSQKSPSILNVCIPVAMFPNICRHLVIIRSLHEKRAGSPLSYRSLVQLNRYASRICTVHSRRASRGCNLGNINDCTSQVA